MTGLDHLEQRVGAYPLLAFGAVFLAGVISSASPCVLTTIPLVVGFFGVVSSPCANKTRCGLSRLACNLASVHHQGGTNER